MTQNPVVVIRGAGDLASAVAHRLFKSGFAVIMLEIPNPSSIRRTVCFSTAIYSNEMCIDGVDAKYCTNPKMAIDVTASGEVAVMADPEMKFLRELNPLVLIDAIIAKKNLGTKINDAPLTIALGPGFEAGSDVHCVIETSRGHYLGSLIYKGCAIPNTGVPGIIAGVGADRVVHSTCAGTLKIVRDIGNVVKAGDVLAIIDGEEQKSKIDGVVRGMIRDGFIVPNAHFKIADVDPRAESKEYTTKPSDKARAIAGGVLECIMNFASKNSLLKYDLSCFDSNKHDVGSTKNSNIQIDATDSSLVAYTDGSYNVQYHEYSYGAVILDGKREIKLSRRFHQNEFSNFRNVAGELEAAMAVINYAIKNGAKKLTICYDYFGVEYWFTGKWKANTTCTKKYADFALQVKNKLTVEFVKIKAHSGDKYNTMADELAANASYEEMLE